MPPVRQLPVLQNWDCRGCGDCCREYRVAVTEGERQRILGQGWEGDPEIAGLPLFVGQGPPWARRYRLNQRADGSCVFLGKDGLCRIHAKFGAAAKPLACRLYPFILIPAADHWRVSLRFACPSAAASRGKPLADYQAELDGYAALLAKQAAGDMATMPAPELQAGQRVAWPDLLRFVQALTAILRNPHERLERRVRKCLALVALCRRARFAQVTGGRLVEFLNLVGAGLDEEVPEDPAPLPAPSWVGRVLFRQALAVYARKDHGLLRNLERSRLALIRAAWRFARGTGRVPRVHGWLPETTFEQVESRTGPLTDPEEQVLQRYYVIKVNSLQFCGASHFGYGFWDGLEALFLTYPVILWVRRALGDLPPGEAVTRAVSMVDNNFGYNPILGTSRQRAGLRLLARRGELEKLTAWLSR
jgi:lysine-N-methylase